MTWQQYVEGATRRRRSAATAARAVRQPERGARRPALYGEPKYLAVFDYTVPSLNGLPSASWSYHVYQDLGGEPDPSKQHTPVQGLLIYSLDCDLGGESLPPSLSPLIEYGVLDGRLVANFWDFYGPFDTYMTARAGITYGTEPTRTVDDLRRLIGHSRPIAAQVYTSPPVSAENRGWYQIPKRRPDKARESFAALSAALTGFTEAELWGTGMVEPYLDELFATVGDAIVARLLTAGEEALRTDGLKALVLGRPRPRPGRPHHDHPLVPGPWTPLPSDWRDRHGASPLDVPRVISADAYAAGLVWRAVGRPSMAPSHPATARGRTPGGGRPMSADYDVAIVGAGRSAILARAARSRRRARAVLEAGAGRRPHLGRLPGQRRAVPGGRLQGPELALLLAGRRAFAERARHPQAVPGQPAGRHRLLRPGRPAAVRDRLPAVAGRDDAALARHLPADGASPTSRPRAVTAMGATGRSATTSWSRW